MRVGKRLLGHHADDLPCAAQPLRVRLHRRDADGLVRAFDDDLRGLGKRRDQRAGRDDAERLCLVRREAAHPLVQHRRDNYVVIAVLCKIFLRQLLKCANCGDVLDQVAALAVADRDVFHALLRRKQRLDDGDRVGNAGRHERAGQRPIRLTVDGNAHFLIQAGQPVDILPVGDGRLHRDVFAVGQIVGDAAALVAGEAARVGDLGQKPGVGGAVAHLHRHIDALHDSPAAGNTVVDGREAVEHGAALLLGGLDALLGLVIAVLAGVAVDGGRQQICLALFFQILHELDVLLEHRHTGTRLDERPVLLFRFDQSGGKIAARLLLLLIRRGLRQIDVPARRPLLQNLLPHCHEFPFRDLSVLNFHQLISSFMIWSAISGSLCASRPIAARI